MRKFNMMIRGILILYPVFLLTACTGRNDMVLELSGPGETYEETSEEVRETETEESREAEMEAGKDGAGMPETEPSVPEEIYVHICGAVAEPGVYMLAAGSRVFEGIAAAGGFSGDACEDFINQAGILQDGQRLRIPTLEEAEAAGESGIDEKDFITSDMDTAGALSPDDAGETPSNGDGRIDINTASEAELSGITGIGAGKAAAIVQYRNENGSFAAIEDIMKVSGIKEGTFEKIKDKITVN